MYLYYFIHNNCYSMSFPIAFAKHLTPVATQDFICSASSCHDVDKSFCESISFAAGAVANHVHVKRRKRCYATRVQTKKCKRPDRQCQTCKILKKSYIKKYFNKCIMLQYKYTKLFDAFLQFKRHNEYFLVLCILN